MASSKQRRVSISLKSHIMLTLMGYQLTKSKGTLHYLLMCLLIKLQSSSMRTHESFSVLYVIDAKLHLKFTWYLYFSGRGQKTLVCIQCPRQNCIKKWVVLNFARIVTASNHVTQNVYNNGPSTPQLSHSTTVMTLELYLNQRPDNLLRSTLMFNLGKSFAHFLFIRHDSDV